MRTKIRNILYYGGLDKATYNKYQSHILRQDMRFLSVFSAATGLGFLVFGIASVLTGQMEGINTVLYLVTAGVMLLLFAVQELLSRMMLRSTLWQEILIYLYMASIYAESIILTVQHVDMPSVTYIGVMLMLPMLFARRPVCTISLQAISTLIFCLMSNQYKHPDIAFTDTWNGITFFVVSAASIVFVVPIRIKAIVQAQIVKELSEYDMLTRVKNRNSFEIDCTEFEKRNCREITVIYADANGLHELNNQKGHAAGDQMLKTVAECLREAFCKSGIYRIGGDEFLVIAESEGAAWARGSIETAKRAIEQNGYSVSFGFAERNAEETLTSLIARAEADMYAKKSEYYRSAENDRRKHR